MYAVISLSPYYRQSTRQTRREVLRHRAVRDRTLSVVLSAAGPEAVPFLEVAMDPHSLYVVGFRAFGGPFWWEFEPEGNLPALAGPTRRIIGGPSNYTNLGLAQLDQHVIEPWRFMAEMRDFNGRLDDRGKANAILLCFLVAEALRFDTIQQLCYEWINQTERYFQAPDFHHRNPGGMTQHRIVFSAEAKATVRSWRTQTADQSPDVMVPWIA
jgi:hypothetical protein